jgi:hypothetical protein
LTSSIASIAPKLLPQRVSRVLTNRVDMGSASKIMDAVNKREKILIAKPGEEDLKTNIRSKMNN